MFALEVIEETSVTLSTIFSAHPVHKKKPQQKTPHYFWYIAVAFVSWCCERAYNSDVFIGHHHGSMCQCKCKEWKEVDHCMELGKQPRVTVVQIFSLLYFCVIIWHLHLLNNRDNKTRCTFLHNTAGEIWAESYDWQSKIIFHFVKLHMGFMISRQDFKFQAKKLPHILHIMQAVHWLYVGTHKEKYHKELTVYVFQRIKWNS